VSLFVWLLPLDLSGMGGPTSSYATAGIALRVTGALKTHYYDKVETPSVGYHYFNYYNYLNDINYFVCLSCVYIFTRAYSEIDHWGVKSASK
jgi:hypothetical protein